MENNKSGKNHWTQAKVNEMAKRINQDKYKRNRQAHYSYKWMI